MFDQIIENYLDSDKKYSSYYSKLLIEVAESLLEALSKNVDKRFSMKKPVDVLWQCGILEDPTIPGEVLIRPGNIKSISQSEVCLSLKNSGVIKGYSDYKGNPIIVQEDGKLVYENSPKFSGDERIKLKLERSKVIHSYVICKYMESSPEVEEENEFFVYQYLNSPRRIPKLLTIEVVEK